MQKIFLQKIVWKTVFKDVCKFYIYLIIFYGLAIILLWANLYLSLESYKMDMKEVWSNAHLANSNEQKFSVQSYELLIKSTKIYMFALACFGVFFSLPPKNIKYVTVVTILISLTINMPFFYDTATEFFKDNLYLFCCVLFAWLSSHVWFKFK